MSLEHAKAEREQPYANCEQDGSYGAARSTECSDIRFKLVKKFSLF